MNYLPIACDECGKPLRADLDTRVQCSEGHSVRIEDLRAEYTALIRNGEWVTTSYSLDPALYD
jgi:hypothetical protein